MTAVDYTATSIAPARTPGRRGLAGSVLVLGFATLLAPYAWSDAYRFSGFADTVVPAVLWPAVPFAAVSWLLMRPRPLGWRTAAALTAALLAAAVVAQIQLVADPTGRAAQVFLGGPVVLLLLIAGVRNVALHGDLRREAVASGGPADRTPHLLAGTATLAFVALLVGRFAGIGDTDLISTFVLIFASIAVEALPFVLLGGLVSGAIQVFVPDRVFERVGRMPLRWQVPAAIGCGLAFPVCECGSIPVARRLIVRGMHPAAGLTFMLAAPVLNPVVLLSTVVAYQGRDPLGITVARASLGMVVAVAVGLVIGRSRAGTLLAARAGASCHTHDHGSGRIRSFIAHASNDFTFMGKFVVLGAALAAALQVLVPQSTYTGVLASPLVGATLLMGAAYLLSLCSEADAFVAVSFIGFPVGAQLAFLVFGPMLDLKLTFLYAATFGRAFLLRLFLVTAPLTLAGAMLYQGVFG